MKKIIFILSLILFLELFIGKSYYYEINNITFYEEPLVNEVVENDQTEPTQPNETPIEDNKDEPQDVQEETDNPPVTNNIPVETTPPSTTYRNTSPRTYYKPQPQQEEKIEETEEVTQEENTEVVDENNDTDKLDIAINKKNDIDIKNTSNYKQEEKSMKNKLIVILTVLGLGLVACTTYILIKHKYS